MLGNKLAITPRSGSGWLTPSDKSRYRTSSGFGSICPICAAGQVPSLCLKFPIRGGRCILGGACQNYGREKLNLQTEHGVDPCARALGRRLSAFKRGKRRLLGGWHRSRRLLDGRLIHRGHRSRSAGSCDARDCSGWWGSELLQIGKIARLFGARLNGGE
jgi:hypothetical protein